ncbi:hypothetical protein V6N13_149530 [Hibiscus sabdariffa]|uniref:Uncharacterized protein n=1 Tax=Hibiscus sabdariffa TaxID=183260 RepID=A0ABR2EH23_9ROSI
MPIGCFKRLSYPLTYNFHDVINRNPESKKLEFCMELVELAIKFVIVVAEAVEKAVNDINHRRPSVAMMATRSFPAPVPPVDFL